MNEVMIVQPYFYLALAIILEIIGSSMLKSSAGFTKLIPSIGAVAGIGAAFYFLSLSLQNIPLSMAYAIWSGVGTALTALVGIMIWKENISIYSVVGIIMIIGGVIVLNMKAAPH